MGISIAERTFEGPFSSTSSLKNASGVYVILDNQVTSYKVVDVGESSDVKTRVENHDRADCWSRNSKDLRYAVFYTPGWTEDQRRTLERAIRSKFDPPCGKI